jgi:hypothetical protein
MTGRTHRNRVAHGLLTGLLVAGVALVARPAFPGENQSLSSGQTQTGSGASAPQQPAAVPGGASGMRIHIDPQTGAILREPAPGTVPLQLTPKLQNSLSTSHQGLAEVPSSVAGGGVKLDLQGRFQSPLFVTTDANGKIKMQHLDETPESGDRK